LESYGATDVIYNLGNFVALAALDMEAKDADVQVAAEFENMQSLYRLADLPRLEKDAFERILWTAQTFGPSRNRDGLSHLLMTREFNALGPGLVDDAKVQAWTRITGYKFPDGIVDYKGSVQIHVRSAFITAESVTAKNVMVVCDMRGLRSLREARLEEEREAEDESNDDDQDSD